MLMARLAAEIAISRMPVGYCLRNDLHAQSTVDTKIYQQRSSLFSCFAETAHVF